MPASIDTQVAHIIDWQAKVETVGSLRKIIGHVSAFKATAGLLEFSCVKRCFLAIASSRAAGLKRVETGSRITETGCSECFWRPNATCILEGPSLIVTPCRLPRIDEHTAPCQAVRH